MGIFSNILSFGIGVGATYICVPAINEAVSKIREDTEAIMTSRDAINRLCVDKIARWYYEGTLQEALDNIIQQANTNTHRQEVASLQEGFVESDIKKSLMKSLAPGSIPVQQIQS